jgi:hypothetical protein
MRTKIWLLSLSLVFSGCFSYKHLDMQGDPLNLGDYYQVTTLSGHTWQGKVVGVNDNTITLGIEAGKRIDIPMAQLKEVQRRKPAVGKIIGLSASITGVALGISALIVAAAFESTNKTLSNINLQF